jgi:hypothetical protein
MFANQYPSEVVGMVLVDSSHPDQDDRFPPEARKLAAASYYLIRAMQFTLPIGLPRLLASRSVPLEVRPEFCAVFCRRQFLAAVRAKQPPSRKIPRRFELSLRWVICHWWCFPTIPIRCGFQGI